MRKGLLILKEHALDSVLRDFANAKVSIFQRTQNVKRFGTAQTKFLLH